MLFCCCFVTLCFAFSCVVVFISNLSEFICLLPLNIMLFYMLLCFLNLLFFFSLFSYLVMNFEP